VATRVCPPNAWQRWMNTTLAPIRGQVARAFGTLKCSYGWRRELFRNAAHLHLLCTAMNLRHTNG
jgi:IS5 family transposase